MAVKFSVYQTPKPKDRKGQAYSHARLQTRGTKRMADICLYSKEVSSFSPADIKGVLEILFDYVTMELKDGYNVELENFGYFSVALTNRLVVGRRGKKVGQVAIEGVNFRCSTRLKNEVQMARLKRERRPRPAFPDIEARKKRMLDYLELYASINQADYASINGCTRYRAAKDIRQFLEEGLIGSSGRGTHKFYLLLAD